MSSLKKSLLFYFFLISLLASFLPGNASNSQISSPGDSTSYIVIDNILIVGNDKTKEKIILRELSFEEGDTIAKSNLEDAITKSRNRIFNTTLFVTVDLILIDRETVKKDLLIHVKERWYTFPTPIFELADRNFNEWWQQRNRDLDRINLGVNFVQKNMRGRNETLKAKFQLGFTKKFELFYFIPYINKNQKTGISFDLSYMINKQIAFKTSNNKLMYFEGNDYIRHKFRTGILFNYRKKFYQIHSGGISFYYNTIADTVAKLNPNYLLNSQTTQRYFSIRYTFTYDRRDILYYPLKGSFFRTDIEKLGIGIFNEINQLNIISEYSIFRPLLKKLYFAGGLKQKVSFPTKQPYLQTRALGYEKDYVSGYELYVIDGQLFSLAKANLKYQLFSTKKHVEDLPANQFQTLPIAVYFRMYSDAGYVTDNTLNPENKRLTNKFLLGGGVGFDVVSYYDFVMRVEYSLNRLGGHGFFLHFKSAI